MHCGIYRRAVHRGRENQAHACAQPSGISLENRKGKNMNVWDSINILLAVFVFVMFVKLNKQERKSNEQNDEKDYENMGW